MKRSISTFLLVAFFTATYGQETTITIPEITKAEYLKKSKNQKRSAWILAGVGTLSVLLGAIEVNPDYGESTNRPFLLIGGLVMIGASVSLFIASARNKKRGMSMSFKNENTQQILNSSIVNRNIPSLNWKLNL